MGAMAGLTYNKAWGRHYYETLVYPMVPIINVEQLANLRRRNVNVFIQKARTIGSPDPETREAIIDHLTDYISGDIGTVLSARFQADLVSALKKDHPEVYQSARQLTEYFKRELSDKQKTSFIKNSIALAVSNVRLLYYSIREDLLVARKDHIADVILAKQVIYETANLMDRCYSQISKRKRLRTLPREASKYLNLALYLLLRLEAVRRGKLDTIALHDDLTIASQYTPTKVPEEYLGTMDDILGLMGT